MNFEILGTIASIIILVSFLLDNEKGIRIVNIIGCVVFIVYGILIGAFSVWFLNGALLLVHIYKLTKKE